MNKLSQVLSELKDCGKTLISISDSLAEIFSNTDNDEGSTSVPKPELTFLDIRKKFTELSRAGHTEALKTLLSKYGADKLSNVDPVNYAALLADAEAIK